MVYKVYRYSNKATAVSAISSLAAVILAILGIGQFTMAVESAIHFILGAIIVIAAVFCFVYLSRILPDKIAEKDFAVKIKTNANVALLYCKDHPEMFEEVAAGNPAFAAKYRMDENGKIVKNK